SGAGTLGVPMVLTIHGSDLELGRSRAMRSSVTGPVREAAAVVAVSKDLANKLGEFMPPGVEPRVIPGGVDASLLGIERVWPPEHSGPVELLFVGRLLQEKGVFELCEALARVRDGFHLTVVGAGPAREAMAARFDRAGLSHAIDFVGAQAHDSVIEMMRAADLVVMPSHREGCGIVPIEAAAVGTPVLVTRTGAMPEVAVCPESVVEPGDAEGLERALRTMLADRELRERCAVAARAKVREEFTWDHIADQYISLYEEVLAGARAIPGTPGR
ncbi:glycosyltransferase family 1 protein, partial [bacterium]|nr:glycosyltransferase family 1 protein [bacterium]